MNTFRKILSMFSEPENDTGVTWNTLSDDNDFKKMLERSRKRPQLLYKHSTICSFSRMAKGELISASEDIREKADINYLGVIESRALSNKAAQQLGVRHESPQIILIEEEEAVWDTSHGGVKGTNILKQL